MSTTKKVTYLNDFKTIDSINSGIINNSAYMSYLGTFLESNNGLTRNGINKGVIYSDYCSNLISLSNSYISMKLNFPHDIINGVHSKIKSTNQSYFLLGTNVGMNGIKTPGISIIMTNNGIEYTISSSSGTFQMIDTYSNIVANEEMFIEFFWTSSSNFPIYGNSNIIVKVNGECILGGIAPINNDTLTAYNFYMLDNLSMLSDLECTIKFLSIYNAIPKFVEDELYSSSSYSYSSVLDLSSSSSSSSSNSLDSHGSTLSSEEDSFLCNVFLKSFGEKGYNKSFDILGMPDFDLSIRKFKTYNIPDRLIISTDDEQLYDTGQIATGNNYIEKELVIPSGHELLSIQVIPGFVEENYIKDSSWILKIDCEEKSSSMSGLSESDQSESNQSESDQSESDQSFFSESKSEVSNSSNSESSLSGTSISESSHSESSLSGTSISESDPSESSMSESTFKEVELPNRLSIDGHLYNNGYYYTIVGAPIISAYFSGNTERDYEYFVDITFHNDIAGDEIWNTTLRFDYETNQWLISSASIQGEAFTTKTGPEAYPVGEYYARIGDGVTDYHVTLLATQYISALTSSGSESSVSESSISDSEISNSSISESSFSESSRSESSVSESSQSESSQSELSSSESSRESKSSQSESSLSESSQSESTESVSYLKEWWESMSDRSESDQSESDRSESDRSESERSESSRSEKSESDQSESNQSESDQSESWNSSQSESTESESDKDQSESTESVSYLKERWQSQSDRSESDRSEIDPGDYEDHIYFTSANMTMPGSPAGMLKINPRNDSVSVIGSFSGYCGYGIIKKNLYRKYLYLSPSGTNYSRNIKKYDVINNTYSNVGTANSVGYYGASVVGNNVYFAPSYSNTLVGILKLDTLTDTTSLIGSGNGYMGCVAVGTDVYFTPRSDNKILKLDTLTDTTSLIGNNIYGYGGCVAIGTDVYFAPYQQDNRIVKLDTLTSTTSLIGDPIIGESFFGCAAVGTNVYFSPYYGTRILKLDTLTGNTSLVGDTIRDNTGGWPFYAGCIAYGTNVYFAPYFANRVLKLDTLTNTTSFIGDEYTSTYQWHHI